MNGVASRPSQAAGTSTLQSEAQPQSGVRVRSSQLYAGSWRALVRVAPPVLFAIAAVATWQLVVSVLNTSPDVVPKPTRVATTLHDDWGLIAHSTRTTVVEILYGFGLSVGIGVFLALVFARFRAIDRAVYPIIVIFQSVPKIAIAPLLILWFGFGTAPKAILIAAIAFFPITVTMRTGLDAVNPDLVLLLRSVGASRNEILFRVQVPTSIPYLFAGLHVAITLSVIGAIVAEFAGASSGLGYLIQFASTQLETPLVFASIAVISVIGIALYYGVSLLEIALSRRFPRQEGVPTA
jgi:NitT/TauT family transport system permease protein